MKQMTKAWVLWAVPADGAQYAGIINRLNPTNNRRFPESELQKVPGMLSELIEKGLVCIEHEGDIKLYRKTKGAKQELQKLEQVNA